jgi:hypothetical protein
MKPMIDWEQIKLILPNIIENNKNDMVQFDCYNFNSVILIKNYVDLKTINIKCLEQNTHCIIINFDIKKDNWLFELEHYQLFYMISKLYEKLI